MCVYNFQAPISRQRSKHCDDMAGEVSEWSWGVVGEWEVGFGVGQGNGVIPFSNLAGLGSLDRGFGNHHLLRVLGVAQLGLSHLQAERVHDGGANAPQQNRLHHVPADSGG